MNNSKLPSHLRAKLSPFAYLTLRQQQGGAKAPKVARKTKAAESAPVPSFAHLLTAEVAMQSTPKAQTTDAKRTPPIATRAVSLRVENPKALAERILAAGRGHAGR